ncbi:MAG TPA: hypothetical protein VGM77_12995 [Gemmatimonadales bacterium]|jgi:hypothetical protein
MRAAFAEIVDYAGLFPPASCSMEQAVKQYDEYRKSTDRWMLGRFVVAAIRLEEMTEVVTRLGIQPNPDDPWRLSVVMGALIADELARIAQFQAAWQGRGIIADSVEYRVSSVGQVRVVAEQIPAHFRRFFEVPLATLPDGLVGEIGLAGAFAKIRTGGTTADLFPTVPDLVRFLGEAARHKVPFKATAGLHHPLRGGYPLTYDVHSEHVLMYGFVNLLLATAEFIRGGEDETAEAILDEQFARVFVRDGADIRWRGVRFTAQELAVAHQQLFLGFGSCSFREPVDELGLGVNV